MHSEGVAKQSVVVLFFLEKCYLIKTVQGRKEISEEHIAQGFQSQVSCHCSAYCKRRDLVWSVVRPPVLPHISVLSSFLAFHSELQKVSFSFHVRKKCNFECRIFCRVDFCSS